MDTGKVTMPNAQYFNVPVQGVFQGRLMQVKGVHFQDLRPYLTISDNRVGSLSLPLCVAPGINKIDLGRLRTNKLDLSLTKTHLGEPVFFLDTKTSQKSGCFLSRALSSIRYKQADFWVNQATKLRSDEFVECQGKIFNKRQCYLKALSLSNTMSVAWLGLGCTLKLGDEIEVNDEFFDSKRCYLQALQLNNFDTNENLGIGWSNLGRNLSRNEIINVFDEVYTAKQCHLKSLSIDIDNHAAWYGLGDSLNSHQNELIEINGKKIGARGCFVNSLELKINQGSAWNSLGVLLHQNENVEVSGQTYSKHECLLEALHFDNHNTYLWGEVGKTIPGKNSIVEVNNKTYSQLQCFLKAISLDTGNDVALVYLGEALGEKETIAINDTDMDSRDCYIKALEISSNSSARAWNNLGVLLFPGETVEISGEIATERECYVRAIQLFQAELDHQGWYTIMALETSSNIAKAWGNLGAFLAPGETVEINGELVTQRECYVRANGLVSTREDDLGDLSLVSCPGKIIGIEEDPVKTIPLRRRNVRDVSSPQS